MVTPNQVGGWNWWIFLFAVDENVRCLLYWSCLADGAVPEYHRCEQSIWSIEAAFCFIILLTRNFDITIRVRLESEKLAFKTRLIVKKKSWTNNIAIQGIRKSSSNNYLTGWYWSFIKFCQACSRIMIEVQYFATRLAIVICAITIMCYEPSLTTDEYIVSI